MTLAGLLFILLLGIRIDLFKEKPFYIPLNTPAESEKETWMNIFQSGRKIGYSHRRLTPRDNGYYLLESTFMRVNTMGLSQDIHIRTKGNLNPDYSLASFDFDLRSSKFNFKAHGHVEGKTLYVITGDQKLTIPTDNSIYLTAGIFDAASVSGMEPNQTRTFLVFDPATMGQRPVRITMTGQETLDIMGHKQNTKKVSVDFAGTTQTAWIGEDGKVVQEEGFMGIKLKQVAKKEALSGLDVIASQDITKLASVSSNVTLNNPEKLTLLRIKLTGINDNIILNKGRQTFDNKILTISKEAIPDLSEISIKEQEKLLNSVLQKPTPFIQSDDPKIIKKVSEIVSSEDSMLIRAQKIIEWIYENIEKKPVLSIPNALETLKNRVGDCNEHAVLLAAMARAAGIPAEIEAGLVYMDGRFYYHAWNILYIGDWITADSLMGQMPADVTHISFVRGGPDQQIDLMGIIGKINLTVLMAS